MTIYHAFVLLGLLTLAFGVGQYEEPGGEGLGLTAMVLGAVLAIGTALTHPGMFGGLA